VTQLGPALPRACPPFPVTAPHRVVPNLRPLGAGPHLVLDDAYPRALARKVARLTVEPERCRVRDPDEPDDEGLTAALAAVVDLQAAQLGAPPDRPVGRAGDRVRFAALGIEAALDRHGRGARLRADGEPWPVLGQAGVAAQAVLAGRTGVAALADAVSLACSDDLAILRRRARGRATTELLMVCFPSSWAPADRGGADHTALHAPVGDNARLLAAGPALTEALLTKGPFLQHAWGIEPTDRLDLDPGSTASPPLRDDPSAPVPPAAHHLRVERQTSLPLPALDRALFTIRLFVTPLPVVAADPDRRALLAAALATMSPATVAYKALERRRDDLVRWLTGPEGDRRSPATAPPRRGTGSRHGEP